MKDALEAKKPIIAITADLKQFFHKVSPRYLLDPEFISSTKLKLSNDQRIFTEQFIQSLEAWIRETPGSPSVGLPVGISAPRLVANVILQRFDRFISRDLAPLYYGRYVDDVFIVLENTKEFSTSTEVWDFIVGRSNGLVEKEVAEEVSGVESAGYRIKLPYSKESDLIFRGKKQKVFVLEGTSGSSLLEAILHNITRRSSDWRLLPDLPTDEKDLAFDFLHAGRDAAEEVDNLRKADGITVQRLGFALRLRNFEAVRRDLRPEQWKHHRERLYRIALDHIITAPGIFTYSPYIARLVSLAVSCGDFQRAAQLIERIVKVFDLVQRTSNAHQIELDMAQGATIASCFEACIKGLASFSFVYGNQDDYGLESVLNAFFEAGHEQVSVSEARRLARMLLRSDLGVDAFRQQWVDGEAGQDLSGEPLMFLPASLRDTLHLDDAREFLLTANFPPHCKPGLSRRNALPRTIAFPTRPFTTAEISLLDQNCLWQWEVFRKWVTALRGREFDEEDSARHPPGPNEVEVRWADIENDGKTRFAFVPNENGPRKPLIALPAFATKDESWKATVMGLPEPDSQRYFRINGLINAALRARPRPHYFVLPELSMPRRWFDLAAHRLEHSGISLVAGLEYEHWNDGSTGGMPYVSNQVRASLVNNILGHQSLVYYQQEKERPAPKEADDLRQVANKVLKPRNPIVRAVIQHENFHFGILICSELTNIHLRADFRGTVDALLVPEWNKDIHSFSSLVEAAALDVHCFVIQVNNRHYGDCRIRAPYQAEYRRDLARVRGGEADYFVIAEIDVPALRAFQSVSLSPPKPEFKPKPDGYEINPRRINLGNERE